MKTKAFLFVILLGIISTVFAQNEPVAIKTFDRLYPNHSSYSSSLFTDIYKFSFYDNTAGEFKYVVIDTVGNVLALSSDNEQLEYDEIYLKNIPEKESVKINKAKDTNANVLYMIQCTMPEGKNILYLLNKDMVIIRKGQRKK